VLGKLRSAQRGRLAAMMFAIFTAATLSGCSSWSWLHFGSDDEAYDYRKAKPQQQPLEVPPDLSQLPKDDRYSLPTTGNAAAKPAAAGAAKPGESGAAAPSTVASTEPPNVTTPSTVAPAGVVVAPAVVDARIVRDGQQSWLEVDATPEVTYTTIKDLWVNMGFKIATDEPTFGVLATDWSVERPKIDQGALRNALEKFLGSGYTNGERIKYKALIERTSKNTSVVTISQRGMEEVFVSPLRDQTKWQWVPPRPELEAEMLQRIAVRFSTPPLQVAVAPSVNAAAPASKPSATDAGSQGATVALAAPTPTPAAPSEARVHKVTVGGVVTLQVEDSVDRTWRRVGIALDRSGFTIEERNRDKSSYGVRYLDPEYEASEREKRSWFDKLFKSDAPIPEQQFRIVMSANGTTTTVEIQDHDGKPDTSKTAMHILDQLMEQLL